jgi:hypothetical protein
MELSPKTTARVTGAFYLLTVVAGVIAHGFISERLIVSDDAATTATNILSHQALYRAGYTIYLIEMAAQIAMTVLFYGLLKPVSKSIALLALTFGLVGCTIKTFSRVFYYAPLLVVGGSGDPETLSLLLTINDQGAGMALAFFGVETVLQGYLVAKSTFLPRALGVWSMLAGLGWMTFAWPPLGMGLFMPVVAISLLGALAMIVWLLVFGVNEQRWREQAASDALRPANQSAG